MKNYFKFIIIFFFIVCCKGLETTGQKNTSSPIVKSLVVSSYKIKEDTPLYNRDSVFNNFNKKVTHYNQKGNRILIKDYTKNGTLRKQSNVYYNANDKFKSWVSLDHNLDTISVTKYYYNKNKLLSKTESYNADNKMKSEQLRYFDSNNKLIRFLAFYYNSTIKKLELKYKNDAFGRRVQMSEQTESALGKTDWIHRYFDYDSLNRKISENVKSVTKKFTYDRHNNVIKTKFLNSNNEVSGEYNYKYVYDNNGNWITKISFEEKGKKWVTEREINYYK